MLPGSVRIPQGRGLTEWFHRSYTNIGELALEASAARMRKLRIGFRIPKPTRDVLS
jgi:hypothetical protein